ncbi:type IV secretory system conjugative DNA transfer family protein [Rhodococcus spelaei]|uniref:Type IV secretory system conjugative DNA transfer family protein n=1 Tax=Rhodococcus spelaei TaxID=2546320 RepID=A0A541BLZ9_9NOCA|nr:type IV secretory system conjugative DNA transfer family protein [Rhodococcus spelaei]TQF73356.1 type IV secretory system conjugative DNA transfer family protein [Rhodococcus spelaei]
MTKSDTTTRHGLAWQQIFWPSPLPEEAALGLLRRLAAERRAPRLVLEARADRGGVRYLVGTPLGYRQTVRRHIQEMVTGATVVDCDDERGKVATSRRIRLGDSSRPVQTLDPIATTRSVLSALAAVNGAELLVIQVVLGPRRSPRALPSLGLPARQSLTSKVLHGVTPERDTDRRAAVKAKLGQHGFALTMRLGVTASTVERRQALLLGLLGALGTAEAPDVRVSITAEQPRGINEARSPWIWPLQLSIAEICQLLGWPVGETDTEFPGQPSRHPKLVRPAKIASKTDRFVATTNAPGVSGKLGYSVTDALRHTWVFGPNGTGKSTLLLNLIYQDMAAGRAVVVIEPKDLVADVLARIPANRRDDVVVFDPLDSAPVGINPLMRSGGRSAELVADTLFGVFHALHGDGLGPRSSDILQNALAVLARRDDASLVMLPLLLTNQGFRRSLTQHAMRDDPIASGPFWQWFEGLSDDARSVVVAPLQNKLRPLLRPGLRASLAQRSPRFNIRHVLMEKKILLVPLQKGVLGPEAARLLSAIILAELWQAIRERAALPVIQRHPVMVYVDEVQDYLSLPTDLSDALATARSLGAGFHLAHQFREQLSPSMRAAFEANARSRICFQLNASDAKAMSAGQKVLTPEDFGALPAYHVYASLLQDNTLQPWASGVTLPPPPVCSDPLDIRARSRARFGQPLDDIEAGFAELLVGDRDESVIGRRRRGSS